MAAAIRLVRSGGFILGAGLLTGLALGAVWFYGLPGGAADTPPQAGAGISAAVPDGQARAPEVPAPIEGARAPDFTLPDLDGRQVSLSGLQGKVVLLNFWATWCPPCEAEMPLLQEAYQAWGESGLVVLAVNFDEPAEEVCAFRDRLGLAIPILLDEDGVVQRLYRVRGYPTSYLIDREGRVRVQHVGILSADLLEDYLTELGLAAP